MTSPTQFKANAAVFTVPILPTSERGPLILINEKESLPAFFLAGGDADGAG